MRVEIKTDIRWATVQIEDVRIRKFAEGYFGPYNPAEIEICSSGYKADEVTELVERLALAQRLASQLDSELTDTSQLNAPDPAITWDGERLIIPPLKEAA